MERTLSFWQFTAMAASGFTDQSHWTRVFMTTVDGTQAHAVMSMQKLLATPGTDNTLKLAKDSLRRG